MGFDPLDARIIYLGAEDGVYRSSDGGGEFHAVLDSVFASAIAVAPSDPSVVYAGCASSYDAADGQVYRSLDRGLEWRRVSTRLPRGLRVLKLVVDPTEARRIYMLSGGDLFIPGAARSLHVSSDGGVTWSLLGEELDGMADVDLDPGSPNILYLTTLGWRRGRVFRSADGGATWSFKGPHGGALLVAPGRPGVVRVVEVNRDPSDRNSGVWESRDGGETWLRRSSPSGWHTGWQSPTWALSRNRYGIAKTLGRDLSNPDAIFWVSSQFVLASFDGGRRFEDLYTREVRRGWWRGRGIDNVAVLTLAISEADPPLVFAGSFDIGLWRSLDGGESWQSCNEAAYTGAWKGHGGNTATVLLDPLRSGTAWAAMGETVDRATLVRSDRWGGLGSWQASADGLPRGFVNGLSLDRASPAARRTLFVTANGDVFRSTDDGWSWSRVHPCGTCRTTAIESDGRTVYAGGESGLWRSDRSGDPGSWAEVGPTEMRGESNGSVREFQWEGIHQILPDPGRDGRVYVAAYGPGRGLYCKDDRGGAWRKLHAGNYVRGVAADPMNPGVLYVTSSSAYRAGSQALGSEGILRSADGGHTWSPLNDGLAWPFGGPVVLDPSEPSRVLMGSPGAGFQARTLQR